MTKIAIYGAGGLGRETALMIRQINMVGSRWEIIGFYDDGISKGNIIDDIPVLGGLKEINTVQYDLSVVVAIADSEIRKKIVMALSNPLLNFPVIIHPQAITGDTKKNVFGKGTIITAGNIFTTGIVIGEFVIVNLASTIGHDSIIGSYTTIMPGCHISGNVTVGESSLIGTGAVVLQNLKLGKNCKVGAGAAVIDHVNSGDTVVGIPAKVKSNAGV